MKKVIALAIVLLAAALAAIVLREAPESGEARGTANDSARGAKTSAKLGSEAVLAIAPGRSSAALGSPSRAMSPALKEFYTARGFSALYQRLKAATSRTPEDQWMLAEIITR